MALFKYFKVVKKDGDAVLPNSRGPLAQKIPPSRIDAINDNVKPVVETIMDKRKTTRGTYEKFSSDEKARVAKCAAEHEYCLLFNILLRFGQIILLRKKLFKVGRKI